ncbi:hypothetical protein MdSGHV063 [Musca domestica salivary gland hypertrophy virus]|uniref:Uncharacterized protein n=1 Tax=Musca hytrovirus(isolate Musca domestica/United States/Boucias/-) TaxID=523909 RepID=B2YG40_MHVB|nr:hypothetical protein MdSGHV063 [Musca domestica salivary gland hypertrophy virus]ACD03522.1 hypothetical protein MdSGHV063 [Musca domestica salivary gland hypertrophy virus]
MPPPPPPPAPAFIIELPRRTNYAVSLYIASLTHHYEGWFFPSAVCKKWIRVQNKFVYGKIPRSHRTVCKITLFKVARVQAPTPTSPHPPI